jgi:hypothetical protein
MTVVVFMGMFVDEKLQSSPAKALNLETPWPSKLNKGAHTPLSEAVAGWQTSLCSHLKAIPTKGLMNQSDADVLLSLLCHLQLMNRCFNHFRFAVIPSCRATSAKHHTYTNKHIVNNQNFAAVAGNVKVYIAFGIHALGE